MTWFRTSERSWRGARKRGVSPIIATILLVAMSVVLAAVLYVLISGLTHGTASAPLGTNFSWGITANSTPMSGPVSGCGATGTAHAFCYTIEVAASSVTTSNIRLALRNSAGASIAWPDGGTTTTTCTATTSCNLDPTVNQIDLVSPTAAAPVAAYSTATSGWVLASGFSGSISGGYSVVIYLVGTATINEGLFSYELVGIGASGYSGTVVSNAFG